MSSRLAPSLGRVMPWFVMKRLNQHWPKAYHLLRFGTLNVNTPQHWDDGWARHGRGGFRATDEIPSVRRRIVAIAPRNAVLLDVGCGVGELVTMLAREKRCRCYGVDISGVAIAELNKKGFEGRVSALPVIPYPNEMFDLVICTETLEHVSDAKRTVAEMARVARRGGTLIVSVPDGATDREEVHVHRFAVKRLHRLLSRHFRVNDISVISDGQDRNLLAVATKP